MDAFFEFLKTRSTSARKYAPAVRENAMFRTLYHAGLRSEEAALLDVPGINFGRGRSASWMCALERSAYVQAAAAVGADAGRARCVAARFLADVRPKCPASAMLLPMNPAARCIAVRSATKPRWLVDLAGRPTPERFSPHNYERGVDLVAIQQLLVHWTVSSTMRYVRPSATFIEDAYRRAVTCRWRS